MWRDFKAFMIKQNALALVLGAVTLAGARAAVAQVVPGVTELQRAVAAAEGAIDAARTLPRPALPGGTTATGSAPAGSAATRSAATGSTAARAQARLGAADLLSRLAAVEAATTAARLADAGPSAPGADSAGAARPASPGRVARAASLVARAASVSSVALRLAGVDVLAGGGGSKAGTSLALASSVTNAVGTLSTLRSEVPHVLALLAADAAGTGAGAGYDDAPGLAAVAAGLTAVDEAWRGTRLTYLRSVAATTAARALRDRF